MDGSSMLAWKVSKSSPRLSAPTRSISASPSATLLTSVVSYRLIGSSAMRTPDSRRRRAALRQRGGHPLQRLRLAHARPDQAAQQADDDQGVQPVRDRDVRLRALDGRPPDGRVGIGVRQVFLAPCLARADGRHRQPVSGHPIGQLLRIHGPRITDRQLDAVVPPPRDLRQVAVEVALERDGFEPRRLQGQDDTEFHLTHHNWLSAKT